MTSDSVKESKSSGTGKAHHLKRHLIMKKVEKPVRGIDWSAIFEARPDLEAPGYRELITQIQKEKTNDSND